MFSIKFWTVGEIFMHIRPFAGAKVQAKCTKSHLYAMLAQSLHWRGVSKRNDGVLETSEAALQLLRVGLLRPVITANV